MEIASVLCGAFRAALVAGSAVVFALWLRPVLRSPLAWILLVLPFLIPALLITYAGASFITASDWWSRCAIYVCFQIVRAIPVAALVLEVFPVASSPVAFRCHRLMATGRNTLDIRALGHGPWIAGVAVFCVAFSDFEMASLWNLKTWTVRLFDAHAGGLVLSESLRMALAPLAVQALMIALLWRLVRSASGTKLVGEDQTHEERAEPTHARWCCLVLLCAIGALLPAANVAWESARGLPELLRHATLVRDLNFTGLCAAASITLAWSALCLHRAFLGVLVACGLCGGLLVALLMIALFQIVPGGHSLGATPLPMLMGLAILHIPLAALLTVFIETRKEAEAVHMARQYSASRVLWVLNHSSRVGIVFVLFASAFAEFALSSVLSPPGFMPVYARLHNLAHYGRGPVLSAMLLVSALAPATVAALVWPVLRAFPWKR